MVFHLSITMNDHPIHSFIQSFWSYEKKMFDQVNTVYGQIYGSFIHQERLSFKFDCIFDGLFFRSKPSKWKTGKSKYVSDTHCSMWFPIFIKHQNCHMILRRKNENKNYNLSSWNYVCLTTMYIGYIHSWFSVKINCHYKQVLDLFNSLSQRRKIG